MERSEVTLQQQQLPPTLRNLQPAALQALHHPQPHHGIPTLASHIGPEVHPFDSADANTLSQHFPPDLEGHSSAHCLQTPIAFEQNGHPQPQGGNPPHTPQYQQSHTFQQHHGGQFGVLTPLPALQNQMPPQHGSVGRLQQEQEFFQTPEQSAGKTEGHFRNLKMVPNPPNLQEWRERLFHVNETISLTEDEQVPISSCFAPSNVPLPVTQVPGILSSCR